MFARIFLFIVLTIVIVGFVFGSEKLPGEVAKSKCKEYSQYVKNPEKCNIGLLPTDQFAPEGNVPHMVMLGGQVENERRCGGALISEDYVLVAAHCLKTRSGNKLEVARLGFTNLDSPTEHSQIIKVKKIIPHPEYKPPAVYNDIGLVQLEKKIDVNNYVRPACLHTQAEIEEQQVMVSGWGLTEFLGGQNPKLQKFAINLYDPEECNNTYTKASGSKRLEKGITPLTMLCAMANGTEFEVRGGELQIANKDNLCMYEIIGAQSFGKLSATTEGFPDVYTRISAYIPWIEQVVWGEEK